MSKINHYVNAETNDAYCHFFGPFKVTTSISPYYADFG